MDGIGNCYAAGGFSGTANFDKFTITSRGALDLFIAKYNRSGTLQWIKTAGQSGEVNALDLAMDSNGDCLVVGRFTGTTNFGVTNLVNTSSQNMFLARLATSSELGPISIQPGFSNGVLTLDLTGPIGSLLRIEATEELVPPVNWSSLGNITLYTRTVRFVDASSNQRPRRFYRARLQP